MLFTETNPEQLTGKISLRKVKLDSGGYDSHGTYFGVGQESLWRATDSDNNTCYVRAVTRDAAKAKFTNNATFYR